MSSKGTVTISLDDYHAFLDAHSINLQKSDNLKGTTRELAVFLSYLCSRTELQPLVDSFNLQSKTCKIVFEGNRAAIELRNTDNK